MEEYYQIPLPYPFFVGMGLPEEELALPATLPAEPDNRVPLTTELQLELPGFSQLFDEPEPALAF